MDYLDFELAIDRRGDGAYEVSARSPAGEARAAAPLAFARAEFDAELAHFHAAVRGLRAAEASPPHAPNGAAAGPARRDIVRKGAPAAAASDAGVRALGTALFRAVMVDEVAECWRVSLAKARERGKGLRLQLRIQAPEVAALPWEFLYDPGQDDFTALSAETPVVRYVEVARAPEALAIERPLRVLALVASPGDHAALDAAGERARVERAFANLGALAELAWIEAGTFAALQAALRRGPWHVLHYVGHGGFDAAAGEGVLLLEGEDGRAQPLPASTLGRALAGHPSLRLAVLNACDGARASDDSVFSSAAAALVRRGIPAVVAMQYPITDRAAVEFASELYGGLADGAPVDAAVTSARIRLGAVERRGVEWGTPVLFLRAPDGVLFTTPHTAEWRAPGWRPDARGGTPSGLTGGGAGGAGTAAVVRRRRAAWTVPAAALALPAAAAASLAAARAPAAAVRLDAVVSEATFRLDSARALGDAVPVVDLGAAGLRAIDLPGGGTARSGPWIRPGDPPAAAGPREADMVHVVPVTTTTGSDTGTVRLDLASTTLPAGTLVTVGGTPGTNTYRLTAAGTLPPVGVTLDGPVDVTPGVDALYLTYPAPARLRLVSAARDADSAVVDLDFSLAVRADSATLAPNLPVAGLQLFRLERAEEAGAVVREVSTVLRGALRFGGDGGQARPLAKDADLRLAGARGVVESLRLTDGAVALAFRGTVRGARAGPGDAAPDLMPTRLETMPRGRLAALLAGLALLGAGAAAGLARLRRRPAPNTSDTPKSPNAGAPAPGAAGVAAGASAAVLAAGALAALVPAAAPLLAQRAGTAPPAARALVARVDSRFGDDEADVGAAVVVGADAAALYLATARHVVRKGERRATQVRVTFAASSADTATATVLPNADPRLDLAAMRVPRRGAAAAAALAALDRLGDVRALADGDPVAPVGCPQGECWNVPVPPDRVVGVDRQGVIFQSSFVSPGSSGGALFDGLWELVGLVTEDAPPRANALPMDQVLAQLRQWRVPVQLRRRAVPRAGYRTVVGAALLAPLGTPDNGPALGGRWPSGRLTLVRRTRSRLTLHAAALRLAPANLGVAAGMAGAGVHLGGGRLVVQPFAEAGLGSVEARYDRGGVDLADGRRVPSWQGRRADGLGAGAGVDAQVVVAPHVVLGVVAGSWRFSTPELPAGVRAPGLPNLFVGAGLRWGL